MGKEVWQIEELVVVVAVGWHKGSEGKPEAGLAVGFGVEPEAAVESGAEEYVP